VGGVFAARHRGRRVQLVRRGVVVLVVLHRGILVVVWRVLVVVILQRRQLRRHPAGIPVP
jgi:hypothetical protein